jgi:hypothetical protein
MQTSMPRVGFEPKIAKFEGAKTVHALDSGATVIGTAEQCLSLISGSQNTGCWDSSPSEHTIHTQT